MDTTTDGDADGSIVSHQDESLLSGGGQCSESESQPFNPQPPGAAILVLGNEYLLQMILEQFQDGIDLGTADFDKITPLTRGNLLSAALVSKFFFEPAMNVLWRHLDSLMPLLDLIPSFQRPSRPGGQYTLIGVVLDEHLRRPAFYIRRVRSLRLHRSGTGYPDPPYDIVLSQLQKLKSCFPLQRLSVEISHSVTSLLFLIPSTVKSIVLRELTADTEALAVAFVHTISGAGTTLKSLSISGISLRKHLWDALPGFKNLHSLEVEVERSQIPFSLLKHLAQSTTSLRDLKFKADAKCTFSTPIPENPINNVGRFIHLERLDLCGTSAIVGLLSGCIEAPSLYDISLACSSDGADNASEPDFMACVQRCGSANGVQNSNILQKVRISLTAQTNDITFLTTFEPLKACKQIRLLHIDVPHLLIESEDIVTFVSLGKLAQLRDLRVVYKTSPTGLSIIALRRMAQKLPNLKSLQVSLPRKAKAAYDVEATHQEALTRPGMVLNKLETLVLHKIPKNWDRSVKTAVSVSSSLDYLFPRLKTLEIPQLNTEAGRDWLQGIQDMMALYRKNRMRGLDGVP